MATYFIQQKITPFANQYRVYAGSEGKQGSLQAFAHQKRLALKEKFIFYADESKKETAFELQARSVIDLGATFDVKDASGTVLGTFRKDFKASLFRSTWQVLQPGEDTPGIIVQERSAPLAVLRRIWGFIPIVGEFAFPLRYHFDFVDAQSQEVVGTYNKTTLIRDHYQLTINDETADSYDWRTLVSLGIVMDALQSR